MHIYIYHSDLYKRLSGTSLTSAAEVAEVYRPVATPSAASAAARSASFLLTSRSAPHLTQIEMIGR